MQYDVVIVGAGVSGTALAFVLIEYTDIERIAIVEKHSEPAQVSSHYTQNSQTLHYGDIETNYSREKAEQVSAGARLVEHYLERLASDEGIHRKEHKMVIGVGEDEADALRERYEEFKDLFPELELLDRDGVGEYEPHVLEDRPEDQDIAGFLSHKGYIVDYGRLAKSLLVKARRDDRLDVRLGVGAERLEQDDDAFTVHTSDGSLRTEALVIDAGAMSITLAKQLGYAKHLSILSVAGNFYRTDKKLANGKIYTVQLAKLPFAAPHADPDVHDDSYTRFGPSAKPLLMLERWNYSSTWDYLTSLTWTWNGLRSILRITLDKTYFPYMMRNIAYDLPWIGPRLFARNVTKIFPSLSPSEIYKDKGYGGARPQVIDTKERSIDMGEARIEGDGCIFNITPSPGASMCLANAERDARIIVDEFLEGYSFDENAFEKDLR